MIGLNLNLKTGIESVLMFKKYHAGTIAIPNSQILFKINIKR